MEFHKLVNESDLELHVEHEREHGEVVEEHPIELPLKRRTSVQLALTLEEVEGGSPGLVPRSTTEGVSDVLGWEGAGSRGPGRETAPSRDW